MKNLSILLLLFLCQNYISQDGLVIRHRESVALYAVVTILVFAFVIIGFLGYVVHLRSKNQKMMKEFERARTNFFTNVTHELRTPLAVIISAAQDIQSKNKSDKVLQRDASDIIRHGKGLLDLVNQILDIAKISSDAAPAPTWRRGDVIGLVTMVCEGYLKYAERKDLRIVKGFEVECLEMDFIPSYIIRIVQNLLSNAIKFSFPGSDILVSIRVVPDDSGKAMQLYVCDTGIGMSKEQKNEIFKPFHQAHDDAANIGSGIGLSLVKLTAEAMNGRVEVHSYPSEGSVFIVTIPIKSSDTHEMFDVEEYHPDAMETPTACTNMDDDRGNADAPRILIVEDEPDIARWHMRQLNPEYNFYFAQNGEEGYSKALDIVPDLIITDVVMPVLDGYEFCRKVRESELFDHIPVIMVTVKTQIEDKIRGMESGADAYIYKPFHPDELSVMVLKLLEQRTMLRRKFSDPSLLEDRAAHDEMPVTDRIFVERLSSVIHELITSGKLDYDQLASQFCVGKTQLNRKIKAVTGYTTREYILQIRISMAKQLLIKTDYSIGEIAYRVGIEDVAYFSSLFRKSTGKTPSAFRNR